MAERAAAKAYGGHSDCPERMYGSTCGVCVAARKRIADALEATAKEFAEQALRVVLHRNNLHAQFAFTSVQQAEGFADDVVAKAIAAAERGE
jgi:hypothetical protein